MSAVHISATNSCTGIPAGRINARSVPGAISRCCGTDKLAACPGLMRITWLPRFAISSPARFQEDSRCPLPET